ncbi:aspartate aminotransferase family protein [Catalinimonas sp. 4WD22]|uniref:aspartate aminotransferase family protein n=1 Tax=Catalinimonas locisalis TaxID=3133978 RepID=UPI003100C6FE
MSQRQLFLDHLAQTTHFPLMLEIERAEGIYMYGKDGQKYIDLISGIGVSNLGHRHPEVVKAVKEQLDKYMHLMVYGEFIQSPQIKLAKALSNTLPDLLNTCYFVNSGSEAVEGAIKLAKRFTGRYELVSCVNAYHGSTQGSLSVCGNEGFKQAYRPLLPGVRHIHFGNYDELEQITEHTAAIIIETVQGEAGVRLAKKDYFQILRERCYQTGTLLILDEIQAGFGRTGKFWAFEHYGIVPDILVAAKGMGGGMPIGAFISSAEIMGTLRENPILGHISTFGGHPVSAAASLATLKIIQKEKLHKEVDHKASLFKKYLIHPKIKEFRNKGLMMALGFDSFQTLKPVIDKAIELGVLTDWFLYCDNAMRIAPPLIITDDQVKESCDIILQAIEDAA